MANYLTGDYDAIVQVSTRLINGLLATLHQNAAQADAPLKLPHSATLRVGDPPDLIRVDSLGAMGHWVREHGMVGRAGGTQELREHLASMAPPGAGKRLEDELSVLGRGPAPHEPPDIVRGTVKLQLSAPTISLTTGSTSEVNVHADVRAQYYPDPGAASVASPKHPLHGEVAAAFELRPLSTHTGRKLGIRPSSQHDKIRFQAAPGTDLTAAEVARISDQVRTTVRESFTPLPVDLPPDFPFSAFKALGTGSSQAIALPIQLEGAPLPGDHIQSVANAFIGSSGFALAVSKEYVRTLLRRLSDLVEDSIESFKVYVSKELDVYYTARVMSGPSLSWSNGAITFSVGVKLVGHNSPFEFDLDIDQRLTLALNVSTQVVSIKADGNPEVHGNIIVELVEFLTGAIGRAVKAARDEALPSINEQIHDTFLGARNRLVQGLRSFDTAASVRFTAVEITSHGLIVRGEIDSSRVRRAPIVRIAETDQGQGFSALTSWIPGGRIERLTWSWVEHSGRTKSRIWPGSTRTLVDRHRFVLPKPAGVTELGSICLRIEGTQTAPDGSVVSVTGGDTCHVRGSFGPMVDVPSWWEPVTVPVWRPDASADTSLRDAIAGHIAVQGSPSRRNELTHNSLVYFADWRATDPLAPLEQALAAMTRQKVSLVLVVVLPAGAFDRPRREVEAKLGPVAERASVPLLLTEDHEGGWTRTFAASRTPSAYVVNARRQFVWKHEGVAAPEVLAAALDRHLVPAPAPRSRPLRPAVAPGDRAPDVSFEDDRGQRVALHRLRGREVVFNFWQSWSAPCLEELRRLQGAQARVGRRAPLVVAFHGGKERTVLDTIRAHHDLPFALVQDTDQRIARLYGVGCWPTTISIDADGLVTHVQLGLSPERREAGS